MDSATIREKFLGFFREQRHAVVPSSSLIPDDPSVLLTTAGMQQFKKYYTGELDAKKDFVLDGVPAIGTASIQKSFRTSDIDEVGNERHLTFFEMMGNFSFGGYFKKEAIEFAFDFITKEMGLPIEYVTIFEGKGGIGVPKDEVSRQIWSNLGVPNNKIIEQGMDDVFWGPTGTSGPCGPTTEIYCKNGASQDIEVWNIVFNEFFCSGSREELLAGNAKLKPLPEKGIDTGMGLERLVMCAQKTPTIFETDLFASVAACLPEKTSDRVRRIMTDHIRAIAFLVSDGVLPANKGAGYILRRLMRRVLIHGDLLAVESYKREDRQSLGAIDIENMFREIGKLYCRFYPSLDVRKATEEFLAEYGKFRDALTKGVRELERTDTVNAERAFALYETFGLPFEIIKDIGGEKTANLSQIDFDREFEKHQEISRAGQEKKFGGHGLILDTGELKAGSEEELQKVTRLHTATHLLHQALREVLGDSVRQMGSDITPERTRFDFTFPRKLTPEEIKRTEAIANDRVVDALPVQFEEMTKEEAEKTGALHFFKEKYPDRVKVYFVGRSPETAWSKEFCGGPHATNTKEIGQIRIIKEEAVAAGIRRLRATVD